MPHTARVRDRGGVDHTEEKRLERGEVHGTVLHVDVDVVDVGPGQRAGVLQRQVVGADPKTRSPFDSLPTTELRCGGVSCATGTGANPIAPTMATAVATIRRPAALLGR